MLNGEIFVGYKKDLIVDDPLLGRVSLKNSLADSNFYLLEASDGLDQLKEKNMPTPAIVVSADRQDKTRDHSFELGARDAAE